MVWLIFDPQAGHEQAGHRPALVISPTAYNRIGLMLCCPMTTRIKGYPFEVRIEGEPPGVVLADQVKSLDWRARGAERTERVTRDELGAVRAKAGASPVGGSGEPFGGGAGRTGDVKDRRFAGPRAPGPHNAAYPVPAVLQPSRSVASSAKQECPLGI